ncbi:MAG: branched-chain amino acid ABC transporter permease [Deltaproteobacteria bacterium]|uniref:Branched-chain amino acid ABC transporter permease n=1 Tax=Candidatus Zymogenus saltonus TaxID=2844893 RepID=A0A9D8KHG7_9DELT|nr:branched-chain amino acid ABC transporter permease [Candidatus Zymogenus saltonus]
MDLKRNYYEDIKLIKSNFIGVWTLILLVFLLFFPLFATSFNTHIASTLFINIIIAIGLNILVGYTGQVSLGHAGFLAIGAYTSVLLVMKAGFPMLLAIPTAGLMAALFGFILGLPALRMEGPYLAIATLGFGIAVEQVLGVWDTVLGLFIRFVNLFINLPARIVFGFRGGGGGGEFVPPLDFGPALEFLKGLTGGRMGLKTPTFAIFDTMDTDIFIGAIRLTPDKQVYYLILFITVILVLFAVNLMKSRIGRAFIAIRDSEIAAETVGVNLTYYRTLAFAISAFYAGMAGALQAHMVQFVAPMQYSLISSITMLAIIVVGGLGSILGSIAGAVLFTILPQFLSGHGDLNVIVTGAIMVVIIMLEPLGIRGIWIRLKVYWMMWPF